MTSTISGAGIAVAPIDFSDRTLPNGLRVLLVEDHRVPSVAINVGYRVGGKDDPPGRSGFAHLFEHLMFKGTKNTRPETIDRLTEDIGGLNNAFTADDITNYYEVVPSNYLETLLWAEADRLGSLAVIEEHFHTERDVVIGEYDQRILAEPYGMLDELVNRESFAVHPYKRGVIGDPENLRAATLDDVVAFHRTFYRPDNAVLVVVGDFDPAQANAWIDKYSAACRDRRCRFRASRSSNRRRRRSAPTPIARPTCRCRPSNTPTTFRRGAIPTRRRSTSSKRCSAWARVRASISRWCTASALRPRPTPAPICANSPGSFRCARSRAPRRRSNACARRSMRKSRSCTTRCPADGEMERVRTQIASSFVRSRQTYNNIALALVRSAVERDDPGALNGDLERYRAVTAADVQRVARRYLTVENRTTIEYLPL